MSMKKFMKKLRELLLDEIKLKGYLNIAKKAGYVIIGGDRLYNYSKKVYLILYDELSGKSTLKVVEKFKGKNINVFAIPNLSQLINISNCKIIGLKNKNLSDIIYNIIRN